MPKPVGYLDPPYVRHKKSQAKMGQKNPHWSGNQVGYGGLHSWVRKRIPKPNLCQICQERPAYDLANIDNNYDRNLINWKWLCRKCHMLEDGRLLKLRVKGRVPWNKGKSWNSETKKKISIALIGKSWGKHSTESKRIMSNIRKIWWEKKKQESVGAME